MVFSRSTKSVLKIFVFAAVCSGAFIHAEEKTNVSSEPSKVSVDTNPKDETLTLEDLIANPPVFVTDNAKPTGELRKDCKSSQEFVETINYLRNTEAFKGDEQQNQKIAFEVSRGCTGAAKRFVKSLEYLHNYKMGGRNAFRIAIQLAKKDDRFAEVFLSVLAVAYHPKKLNMDILNSIRAAYDLSLGYKGDPKKAQGDFLDIAKFCNEDPSIRLSLPRCAMLSVDLAKNGENWDAPLAPQFKELVTYLREKQISIYESVIIAADVLKIGPHAVPNFKTAFDFASQKEGMDLDKRGSVQFAMEMSKKTIQDEGTPDYMRLPASLKTTEPKN